ncbi:MAG: CHAD domain-containing protein [Acidimicrobiia bacterium]|nr:CHAD domain-containing protein [Acidimicrobiia bacterium]
MLERELKLAVGDAFDSSALSGRLGPWQLELLESVALDAEYYDTTDFRLLRSGISLRFREGWMVKLAQPSDRPELLQRIEIPFDGPEGSIPAGVLDLTRSAARSAPVLPVARLSTARQTFALRDDAGVDLAEIVFDEVESAAKGRAHVEFRELEIELAEGAPVSVLGPVVARLRQLGAGGVIAIPKLARAVGMSAVPEAVVPVWEPGAAPAVTEIVHGAIARSVRRFLDHCPAVILDEDPEGVHQARVAIRRLRSDLRTFRRFLNRTWADQLRTDLRALTDLLGSVRDLDVLKLRLALLLEDVPDPEREAAEAIIATLSAERADAHQRVVEALREDWFLSLLNRLVAAANAPHVTKLAGKPVDPTLLKLARKPWRVLVAAVGQLPELPSPDELHSVRILAKRTRYAAEALIPVVGANAELFAVRLSELQDVLGEHQDAVVAAAWLRRRHPSQALAAGELIGFEVARANRAAEGWRDVWESINRHPMTSWMG